MSEDVGIGSALPPCTCIGVSSFADMPACLCSRGIRFAARISFGIGCRYDCKTVHPSAYMTRFTITVVSRGPRQALVGIPAGLEFDVIVLALAVVGLIASRILPSLATEPVELVI